LKGFGLTKDYTYCGNDVPNILHASGIWQLPIGKGRAVGKNVSGLADTLVGGWSTQWIVTSQDGFPFTVGCPIGTMSGDFQCYAPLAKGVSAYAHKGPHGIAPFLNTAGFVQPPAATAIGQTDVSPLGGPWNQVHGPGYNDLDLSVFKRFHTLEHTNVEFRAEFFNLLNHPNFASSIGNSNFLADTASNPFGEINSTIGNGRQVEFALKIYW
jgi:hypothetical protein